MSSIDNVKIDGVLVRRRRTT